MEGQENPFGAFHKVNYLQKMGEVCWAHAEPWFGLSDHPHWSRRYEYPWILANGDFQPGMNVLDAAGGKGELSVQIADKGCYVTNVDLDATGRLPHERVAYETGDISRLGDSNYYDRVVCASVLEHTLNPESIITELFRVLKPGGKLLLTFDVASSRRHNHTIDQWTAEGILKKLGLTMPPYPTKTLIQGFPELEPQVYEHDHVILRVLCCYIIKQNG